MGQREHTAIRNSQRLARSCSEINSGRALAHVVDKLRHPIDRWELGQDDDIGVAPENLGPLRGPRLLTAEEPAPHWMFQWSKLISRDPASGVVVWLTPIMVATVQMLATMPSRARPKGAREIARPRRMRSITIAVSPAGKSGKYIKTANATDRSRTTCPTSPATMITDRPITENKRKPFRTCSRIRRREALRLRQSILFP